MQFLEINELESPTGATLAVRHEQAAGKARGIIQINHGLAEHSARYARFARALSEAGYHVYAHDHRGHGETRASDAPPRVFSLEGNGSGKAIADIEAVQTHARKTHPGLPLISFGHSMGGLLAMKHALAHPEGLSAVAVWNSNFSGGIAGRAAQAILRFEKFRLGSDVPSRILPH